MDGSLAPTRTRLRIALVITELDFGGAERCLTELALFLAARGHIVRVWALGSPPTAPYDGLWRQLQQANVDVRFANARGLRHVVRVVRWLRRELADFAPDVVQSMLWHANVVTSLAVSGQACILVGGMRVSEPRRWRWPMERWAARRMSSLVCVSEQVRCHAEQAEGISASKLCVIPNGIASASEHTQRRWSQLSLEPRRHQLLYVGRLEAQKGVLELAGHLPQLLAPLADWSCIIMGRGSLRTAMERAMNHREGWQQIHFADWQPDAAAWMRAADVILLPATYEGMPNVLLEAMQAGKPFVAFAVDGIGELLCDDYPAHLRDAQLVPPNDWPRFVAAIQRLAADESLRQGCGQANLRQVQTHFRLEDQLVRYEQLYQRLVAANHSSRSRM